MQALHDDSCLVREVLDGSTVDNDMGRGDGLVLVEAPDVQLMDGLDTGYLNLVSICEPFIL